MGRRFNGHRIEIAGNKIVWVNSVFAYYSQVMEVLNFSKFTHSVH
jgi:hypothetical protein